jgi:WhiB family transcriptional regulator, redox-sensing transcriptional regulator
MRKETASSIAVMLLRQPLPVLATEAVGPWVAEALCAEMNPETFFPPSGNPGTAAKLICNRCPVRDDCLSYALDANEKFGVWGGLDADERRRLRERMRRKASSPKAPSDGAA